MKNFKSFSFFFLSLLVLILMLLPEIGQAQINLHSNGYASMEASPSSSYKFRVEYNSNASSHTAVYAKSTGGSGAILSYGIQGRSTASGYTNYGVYGAASGGANNWAGYFSGNVYTTGSYQSSDKRFKKNITPINAGDMLSKVGQLKPVRYQFLSEIELRENSLPAINPKEGNHIGLIAQEVEEIFPEFVIDVVQPLEDEQGEVGENPETVVTKAINYQELTVALLAAVQELKAEVETLKAQLNE